MFLVNQNFIKSVARAALCKARFFCCCCWLCHFSKISSPLQLYLSCPVLSCPFSSCPVLSCSVVSCPVLTCPVWSYKILVRYCSFHAAFVNNFTFVFSSNRSRIGWLCGGQFFNKWWSWWWISSNLWNEHRLP